DRSGLPSAVRGAGAVRFGLPSAVRGMPGEGYFNHCASSGPASANKMIAKTTLFIRNLVRTTVVSNRPMEFGKDTNTKWISLYAEVKMSTSHIPFVSAACLLMAAFGVAGTAHAQRSATPAGEAIVPFKIQVSDAVLTDLKRRLAQARFADE